MVYECDQCSAALPGGVLACPQCGEKFDEAVPTDALVPKSGFSAASVPAEELREELNQELTSKLEQAETDITVLRGQSLALKSEVMTLRGYISTLTSEITALEEYSAALQSNSATLQSQVTTLTNRLTVLEMAGREDKRRFIDHVNHMKEALGYIQINGPTGAAGQ